MITRRTLVASGAAAALCGLVRGRSARAQAAAALRIGYQRNGLLVVAKQQGVIEAAVKPFGVACGWSEFPSGPPLLEALRADAIDVAYTGDAPPIFAQAARTDLVYAAALPNGGSASAILLPPGSTLATLAELKGKRVAFAKGSSAHNLTVAALEKVGLSYADIQPVTLAPADAGAALLHGSIDAWTIWDPYYAITEVQPGVRVLARSTDITPQNGYLLASRSFAQAQPRPLAAVVEALAGVARWADAHRDELAGLLAEGTGVPRDAMERAVARSRYAFSPMTEAVVRQQQAVADRFHRIGLIPAPVDIAAAVWRPAS